MDLLIKALESMTVWDLLEVFRHIAIFVISFTIAVTIIFAVASALPSAWHWYVTKNSDCQIAYPFFIGLADNVCWLTYGIYRRDWGITALNVYVISSNVFYITVMYIYRSNRNDLHRLMVIWVVAFICIQGALSQAESNEEAAKLIGQFTVVMQTSGATGLLYLLYKIIRNWRIDFLPFYPVALGLCIETQACTLGLLKGDRYMVLANGYFMIMNAVVFSFFFILPADRQIVLPDLLTFTRQRIEEYRIYRKEREETRKIYSSSPSTVIVDLNENLVV